MTGPSESTGFRDPPAARIGYLLRTYPRFSQTFIVSEILELERRGLDLAILSLCRPDDGVFHESVSRVRAVAQYVPESLARSLRKTAATWGRVATRAAGGLASAAGCVLRHRGAHWRELEQAVYLLRWVDRMRIDHVHAHFGTDAATVALLAHEIEGISFNLTLHAFDVFRADVDRRLLTRKINASRYTVTVSEFNRQWLVCNLPGVDADRIRVCYNGVDLERFTPPSSPRHPGRIAAVGGLIEKKGFVHLVRAAARLRDAGRRVRCTIVGTGPEERCLKGEIAAHKLDGVVELAGPLRQDQVRELSQTAACCVLPCIEASDGNADALPTVLLEALACGCPCVSTRLSGIPEIVEDGVSGLLVPPGDEAALAEAIEAVLADGDLASRLARHGRRRAEERFDIRRSAETLHGWLLAAARSGRAGSAQPVGIAPGGVAGVVRGSP